MSEIQALVLFAMIVVMFGRFFLPSRFFSNKFISYLITPLLLLLLWLGLMIYRAYTVENVFTVLTSSYSHSKLISYPDKEFYAGDKISGKFNASENYLGILGFRFWNFYRLNSDFLEFRIKEVGQSNWYYINQYKSDQFQPNDFFTFGFPVINDSSGKTYQFEIESTGGVPGNAIGVSQIDPVYIVKYKYPREIVTKDYKAAASFLFKKLVNLFQSTSYTAQSFVFLLPLLLYLIFISGVRRNDVPQVLNQLAVVLGKAISTRGRKWLSNKSRLSLTLCYIGLLLDLMLIKYSQIPIIILISAFSYTYLTYKIDHNRLFLTGAICLLLAGVFYYFKTPFSSERFGAWAWIFIFMWLIVQIWKLRVSTTSEK